MGRPARKTYQVTRRVQLVLLPSKKRAPLKYRVQVFLVAHKTAIGVATVVIASIVLVLVRERQLAAVTVASVGDKVADLFGEILSDRLFPGGEFVKGE